MIRGLLVLFLILFAPLSWAQDVSEPLVRTSLEEDTAIPGQPVIYRVTILVPTWIPKPPVFPSFETPNVIVRLPSRASTPVSETIRGETWSGVSRAYRLYPMIPGAFQIPGGEIRVTYADSETRQPVVSDIQVSGIKITGKAPAGSEDLSPFLASQSLALDRTIDGDPATLEAGDALTVTTSIKLTGVSPIFAPEVGFGPSIDGLAVYPKSPVVEERENRGSLSGTRTETAVLVAENAGTYQIPEANLSWFNLGSGKIETATVPAIDLTVSGPPASPQPYETPADWRTIFTFALGLVLLACLLVLLWFKLAPTVKRTWHDLKSRILESEWYAHSQFQRAVRNRNYYEALQSGLLWKERLNADTADWAAIEKASHSLGLGLFGSKEQHKKKADKKAWHALSNTAKTVRRRILKARKAKAETSLPPLNPAPQNFP